MLHTVLKPALLAVVAALMLSGCGNALLFYETGKLSMTLEGRPDSSQPVQGNIGFKQRTAVVAPPMPMGTERANAASMIASFLINKDPGWGPLHIRTGLVTGKASRGLGPAKASQVAKIVAGVKVPTADENAVKAVANAKADGHLAELETLSVKEWKDLSEADKAQLGQMTGTFSLYDETLHNAIRNALKE